MAWRSFSNRDQDPMTALGIIVLCGLLSIAYGAWATTSVMAADAGSDKMQEISAAVREGAQAYLKRQYTTIGIVGVVIFVLLGFLLGLLVAFGFLIGALLSRQDQWNATRKRSGTRSTVNTPMRHWNRTRFW